MTFIPEQPRVTMVSLWCIPLEMEETAVDENLQRFGDIKSRYKSKKNQFGQIINTGVQVYSIVLKNPIPKTSTIWWKQRKDKIHWTRQTHTARQGQEEQTTTTTRRRTRQMRPRKTETIRRRRNGRIPTTTGTTTTTATEQRRTTDIDRTTIYRKTRGHGDINTTGTRGIKTYNGPTT